MNKSEPVVADQGERSVQPFGGDGPHVEAANTREASTPLTSTPKRRENTSPEMLSSNPPQMGSARKALDTAEIMLATLKLLVS